MSQIKIYAGTNTKRKWDEICDGFTSNTAAFAVLVESYYQQQQGSDFEPYREDGDYLQDGVNLGHLPKGTTVMFADGELGRVIEGNAQRSLISYRAAPGSGASEQREWFHNKALFIKTR
jgi:hypothetical protein